MRVIAVSVALLMVAGVLVEAQRRHPVSGRVLAPVMGVAGAGWLERPEREDEEAPSRAIVLLDLKPGMTVADIGAGTGLFTMLFADAVKPGGNVVAVDISPAFVDYIQATAKKRRVRNVTAVVANGTEVGLPEASVDLAYLSDVYHHFEHPAETLASIRKALKPGGRMVVIDYERIPGKTSKARIDHVRVDKQQAIREIEAAGFSLLEEKKKMMRDNYFLVFTRP